jgi:hypothetical protein
MSGEVKKMKAIVISVVLALGIGLTGVASASADSFGAIELTEFDGAALEQSGEAATQAGSRPFSASTTFTLATTVTPANKEYPTDLLKDAIVELPPGLIGNPQGVPQCTEDQLQVLFDCPVGSQVGVLFLDEVGFAGSPGNPAHQFVPLFNMVPPDGSPALLGFNVGGSVFHIGARVRNGEDYGVTAVSFNNSNIISIQRVEVEIWGVPGDPAHDSERGFDVTRVPCASPSINCSNPYPGPPTPFFTLPTSCIGPVTTSIAVTGWNGGEDRASFLSHDTAAPTPNPIGNDGCNAVEFSPSLEARPTTNVADSPSGLDVDLHIPQHNTCVTGPPLDCGVATAHLKDTVVTLPEGLNVNPSSANGLAACSLSEFGFTGMEGDAVHTTPVPAQCPNASKLGTVSVETPVLDHPVEGAVYLAQPYENPFGTLLSLYLAVDDPESGVVVKLAGRVDPDPTTGQLTATFKGNPQLPFEDLNLHFFGGSGASLRTPPTCGTYTTGSSMTPWSAPDSGPPATPKDEWAIEQGPGGSCATEAARLPNSPSFDAGSVSPIAGAKTPLVVNLRRDDGTQQFSSLSLTPPEGLVGKLAGIPYCPDAALAEAAAKSGRAEEASSSCSQASYVGSVTAAAGAGPAPYYAHGKAYLTGPYKGAPLSLAIVTPATAGPFDLGTIVVRTALYVNRRTAQITAISDKIPTILRGIPLDVRSVQVKVDRPDFTINPTSCDPTSFDGQLTSTLVQTTALQSRFQVGECGRLGFKPHLALRLKGGTKRNRYPALTATLRMPEGSANLASISVALPRSEFLAQEHIRTVCTRVQFAADACPTAAIYGNATVTTPLLDYPLTGPVYLRSSDNPLPDLVPDLRGPANQPIKLESAGRTDSIRGGIRNSFDFIPDAPFTKLVLQMQGGKRGLLVNSRDICKRANRAIVKYTAHNGATFESRPALKPGCPKHGKRKAGHRRNQRTLRAAR